MEFSRPEYWSGYPFPSPEDLPNPGIEPRSPTLQADSSPIVGQSVLIHGRLICLIVFFKSCISLLIFRLVVPHIIESRVLKSSDTLVFPFFFFFLYGLHVLEFFP